MTYQDDFEAVMAKMPVLSDEKIGKIFDLAYYQNQAYSAGASNKPYEPEDMMKEVALAQRRLLAEEGWVKLPTEAEIKQWFKQKGWALYTEGYAAYELHRWLATGERSQSE